MLRDRQKSILNFVIRAHIRTGRPVASQELVGRSVFDVSPATIRSEMLELDELGYLEQPHTSAGRVPTDRGYRFFVDHLIADEALREEDRERIDALLRERDEERFIKDLGRAIAEISHAFTAVGMFENPIFYKSGFAEIFEEPEFGDSEEIKAFSRLMDIFDEQIGEMVDGMEEGEVFIGRENPWKEAQGYAMVVCPWKHPAGFNGFFAALGPRRMDYAKTVSLINYLKERR